MYLLYLVTTWWCLSCCCCWLGPDQKYGSSLLFFSYDFDTIIRYICDVPGWCVRCVCVCVQFLHAIAVLLLHFIFGCAVSSFRRFCLNFSLRQPQPSRSVHSVTHIWRIKKDRSLETITTSAAESKAASAIAPLSPHKPDLDSVWKVKPLSANHCLSHICWPAFIRRTF